MTERTDPRQSDLRERTQEGLSRVAEWAREGLSLLRARVEFWREEARVRRHLARQRRDLQRARTDLGRRLITVHRGLVEEAAAEDPAIRGLLDRIDRLEEDLSASSEALRELQAEHAQGREEPEARQ